MRTNLLLAAIGAGALMCATALPAHAERFSVGRLLCGSEARIGMVLGSEQSLRCVFLRANPARQYVYEGRIRRAGIDLGVTTAGTLSWAVFARNSRIGPGTLRGSYVGASGNVSMGPGFGVNVLVGGSRRSIVLQPLSIERTIGLNLAAGVTHLTLVSRGAR
ncbi:MAG: DUF992 domain-containing protein [Bradyrhizobium sp.]|nr:DUF992 domain-containing protein [Bradyrhizobium sp.]